MPKHDYRMPTRRERELFKQARELQARIDALEKDPSAKLEISRLEDIVAERDAAVSELESELESERARTARVRIDLEKSRAKRKGLESQVRQLRCDVGNERARTRSAQARYERMSGSHGLLLEENRSLKARNSELEEELARKDALIEHLNARLSRGPENSSLPPSSEPNRKRIPNSRVKSGRKPGGQPRHPGHGRHMPEPDVEVALDPESGCCPRCGCGMAPTGDVREHSVTDVEVRTRTVAYVSSERRCPRCGKTAWDPFPKGAENEANYGPGVKSFIAYLVGACNVSGDNARGFLRAVTGGEVDVSSGSVPNFMRQFSKMGEADLQEAFDAVATAPVIGSDATFTRSEGHRSYIYVFHGGDAAVYRASDVKGHAGVKGSPLEDAPDATVVSDHDTTYYSYGKRHGECNAHILRDLKGVAQNEPGQVWAEDMSSLLKLANETARRARDAGLGSIDPEVAAKFEAAYKAILESALDGYMSSGATSWKYPPEGIALARRMLKYAGNRLLFLRDLSVPFENNGSERLLRKAKSKTKQSGGFRSTPNGEQPYCDFLTIVETAKMRGIQPYEAVHATFAGEGGLFG